MTEKSPPQKKKLTRRELVKNLGLLGMAAWVTDVVINKGPLDFYDDFFTGITNVNAKEFDNYSSLESCVNKGRAWMIVHRGFIQNDGVLKHLNPDYDPSTYNTYLQNTESLLKYLRDSREPTFIVIENRLYKEESQRHKSSPEICTSLIVTLSNFGEVKRFVHTELGTLEQSLPKLKKTLTKMGIHTICLAGELAYHPTLGGGGCLEGMATHFMNDFDIKGVKNCIYPMVPPSQPWPVQRELYFDQVAVPKI